MTTKEPRDIDALSSLLQAGANRKDLAANDLLKKIQDLIQKSGLVQTNQSFSGKSVEIKTSEDIGKAISARRKVRKINQETLSDLAGVSVGTIKNIESGGNVGMETVLKVTRVLGLKLLCQR